MQVSQSGRESARLQHRRLVVGRNIGHAPALTSATFLSVCPASRGGPLVAMPSGRSHAANALALRTHQMNVDRLPKRRRQFARRHISEAGVLICCFAEIAKIRSSRMLVPVGEQRHCGGVPLPKRPRSPAGACVQLDNVEPFYRVEKPKFAYNSKEYANKKQERICPNRQPSMRRKPFWRA